MQKELSQYDFTVACPATNPGSNIKTDYKVDPKSNCLDIIPVGSHDTDKIIASFKDDVDLNKIIERYEAVEGVNPFNIPVKVSDEVADFTNGPSSLADALNILLRSEANKKIINDALKTVKEKEVINNVENNE